MADLCAREGKQQWHRDTPGADKPSSRLGIRHKPQQSIGFTVAEETSFFFFLNKFLLQQIKINYVTGRSEPSAPCYGETFIPPDISKMTCNSAAVVIRNVKNESFISEGGPRRGRQRGTRRLLIGLISPPSRRFSGLCYMGLIFKKQYFANKCDVQHSKPCRLARFRKRLWLFLLFLFLLYSGYVLAKKSPCKICGRLW